jgi:hypothetical protein
MKKAMGLLSEWGAFVQAHMHHDGFPEENILYRWARVGEVQDKPAADRILCVDTPAHLRRVDVMLKKLPNLEEKCVRIWFCAPLRDDGEPYTKRQLARKLKMSKYKFESVLKYGIRRAERLL